MPSGKMKYIRQRMADKPRTDIELTPLKAEIENIFNKRNIDEDCDTIAAYFRLTVQQLMNLSAKANMLKFSPFCLKSSKASLTTLWRMSTTIISMTCIPPIMFVRT